MTNGNSDSANSAGASVCLSCGLCCDGTIFADLKLKRGDEVARVRLSEILENQPEAVAGQGQEKKWKGAFADGFHRRLPQPCAALSGCRCRIYPDRPDHCRKFDCLLLKRLDSGVVQRETALRLIVAARRQAERVRRLLRRLGDLQEHLSLHRRFRKVTRRLENSTLDEATAERYGELTIAMHDLNFQLSQHFYPGEA